MRSPGLIVVHEWWGLNDDIRAMTERFDREGFVAHAVDLYDGRVTDDPTVAMQYSMDLSTARAVEMIAGAVDDLAARCSGKVGVTGFCLGGAIALAAACNVPALSAAVPFYGTPKDEFLDFTECRVPIQGHYAEHDPFVNAERVRGIVERATAAGASFELHFYDASHGFMRASDTPVATLAWSRTIAFLRAHL